MKKLRIITLALSILAIGLAFSLYKSVKGEQETFLLIKQSEKVIKENLKGIREAQTIYKKQKGFYAENWVTLQNFIINDSLVITDISETIIPRQYEDDSVIVVIDTVETIAVKDSLFGNNKYSSLDINNIKKVPFQEHYFHMHVSNDTISSIFTLYVADTIPLDKMRRKPIIRNNQEKKIKGTKPLLSIGSKVDETLKASWTKE